jgi:hypothetical protein
LSEITNANEANTLSPPSVSTNGGTRRNATVRPQSRPTATPRARQTTTTVVVLQPASSRVAARTPTKETKLPTERSI